MTDSRFTLVGDGIEDPHNALAMVEIATALGAACAFLDRKQLQHSLQTAYPAASPLPLIDLHTLRESYRPVIACDTFQDAVDVFGCRPAPGTHPALVIGNERLGLTHNVQAMAHQRVHIPMATRGIDSLNVAAAAAVALYCLSRGTSSMEVRADPSAHRPDLLLLAPHDHAELGCAIRSAAGFGWGRLLIEDRLGVWFGADRRLRAEGRAAARQSKNSILVLPVESERRYACDEAVVVTATSSPGSIPLHRANLARGARQLLVLPDPDALDWQAEAWARLGRVVRFAHLGLPNQAALLRYRALASIAMAETARQIGRTSPGTQPGPSRRPRYKCELDLIGAREAGEIILLDDLLAY